MVPIDEQLPLVERLTEDEEDDFEEIPGFEGRIKWQENKAVLLHLRIGKMNREEWFPYSQLRLLDGQLYAAVWLLKKMRLIT